MLTDIDSDDGKTEMDKLLAELEKEVLPEESTIPKTDKSKIEKKKYSDDEIGVENMREYEALADVDKENYGI